MKRLVKFSLPALALDRYEFLLRVNVGVSYDSYNKQRFFSSRALPDSNGFTHFVR
jgi:hypothetical protein